jgi:hypothetical protein
MSAIRLFMTSLYAAHPIPHKVDGSLQDLLEQQAVLLTDAGEDRIIGSARLQPMQ